MFLLLVSIFRASFTFSFLELVVAVHSGVHSLHTANGDLTTLNTMSGMHTVAGANMIGSYNPTAVSLAASLAAAATATSRVLTTTKTVSYLFSKMFC